MMLKSRISNPKIVPIRRAGSGYVADGPGFYIWDEDMNEVLRMAREFARGVVNVTSTTRFVRVHETTNGS